MAPQRPQDRIDNERVLESLRTVGGLGISQTDWEGRATPDGGPEIKQIRRRISDLRKLGHQIETRPSKVIGEPARYVLVVEKPAPLPPPAEPDRLFAPPHVNAIYGEAA